MSKRFKLVKLVDFRTPIAEDKGMKSVGIFEAKTHLSELVDQASRGEVIEITRHGKPVARLVRPADESADVRSTEQVLESLRETRRQSKLTPDEIVNLIREGRRY